MSSLIAWCFSIMSLSPASSMDSMEHPRRELAVCLVCSCQRIATKQDYFLFAFFLLRRSLIFQMLEKSLLQMLGLMDKMDPPPPHPKLKILLQAMRRKW